MSRPEFRLTPFREISVTIFVAILVQIPVSKFDWYEDLDKDLRDEDPA